MIGEASLDGSDAGQASGISASAPSQARPETDRTIESTANEPAGSGGSGATADMLRRTIQRSGASSASQAVQAGNNLLFTRQSPVLKVETAGPRRITVGRESSYEVSIQNSGQIGAEQVVVMIDLPDWADVLGAQASTGATNTVPANDQSPRQFRWKVGRLEANGREKLILRIVPRQSRPFDLAVRWDYTPVSSQTMIEVQEAKLAMQLHGPREVLYGKPEVFRLEISNLGNGDAENVALTLAPMESENPPATHQFGTLGAGEKKSIEVELTARHTGTLTIKVDARADGGAEAHLSENILIRRANLQVAVEAPPMQFVGTPLTYRIRVSNPGSAAAQNVQIAATLPADAKYVSSIQGGQLTTDRRKVVWTANNLAPGNEAVLQLTTSPQKPGASRLDVLATADGELMASGDVTTQVEAVADLALSVSDPQGPVPVGEEAVYEIHLQNRGTKSAENVEIVAYFSNGVEPLSAEGGRHRLGPGQVMFDPIPTVAAGQNLVLKIRARADQPGNLVFRAEVYCKPLGTRLVSEETTLFYSGAAAQSPTNASATPQYSPETEASEQATAPSREPAAATPQPRTASRTLKMR
jgi:uncharacterized repeat protein (TIGR01451 family)